MKPTYNNFVSAFREFSERHLQVRTFYSGRDFDFQPGQNSYPAIVLVPQPGGIAFGQVRLSFSVLSIDRAAEGHTNADEVLSDTLQTLADLTSFLRQNEEFEFFTDETEVSVEPLLGELDDDVCGWAAEFSVLLPFVGNTCGLPMAGTVVAKPPA